MKRYFVEVPHEADTLSCALVIKTFLMMGSHYLTHADWGCLDGDHRAFMIVEAESKDEALSIVPPPLREQSHVIELCHFTMEDIQGVLDRHQTSG